MKSPLSIEFNGLFAAVKCLTPMVVYCGSLAEALQPQVAKGIGVHDGKGGSLFHAALTDVDLLVENLLGSLVSLQFLDASFHGEEHERDLISQYIPKDRKYLIILDPVNGTLYYKSGLPTYEVVLSIYDQASMKILAAIAYRPSLKIGYTAIRSTKPGEKQAFYFEADSPDTLRSYHLPKNLGHPAESTILINNIPEKQARHLRQNKLITYRQKEEFEKRESGHLTSLSILLGECSGLIFETVSAYDAYPICFIASQAGGILLDSANHIDRDTLRGKKTIIAATGDIYNECIGTTHLITKPTILWWVF